MLLTQVINFRMDKMAKNGNKKEKDIRTINLGKPGEPARELIEEYERRYGKNKFSKLVREMIVRELSPNEEFDGYKIRTLKEERKFIQEQFKELQRKLLENADKLENLGVDLNDID